MLGLAGNIDDSILNSTDREEKKTAKAINKPLPPDPFHPFGFALERVVCV
jgi:hypothetical protein